MSKGIRELLFSNQCYESPIWPFPEIGFDNSPVFNPLIDASFGDRLEYPVSKEMNADQLLPLLATTLHENHHENLFNTTHRCIMQLEASLIYTFLSTGSGKNPERLDRFILFPLFEEIETRFKESRVVEEVFALRSEVSALHALYKFYKSELDSPGYSPKSIEKHALETEQKEFGSDFSNLYEKYKPIAEGLGGNSQIIERFVLNTPIQSSELLQFLHGCLDVDAERYLLNHYRQSSSAGNLHYSLTSPEERLACVISKLEKDLPNDVNDAPESAALKLFEERIPGFIKGYFCYEEQFIPLLARLYKSKRAASASPLSISSKHILTRSFLSASYSTKELIFHLQNEYKQAAGEIMASIGPSFRIWPHGDIKINPHLRAQYVMSNLLLFWEAIRQQVGRRNGLECFGHYFEDYCSLDQDDKSCPFRKFLGSVWEYSNNYLYTDLEDWTKPTCLK